MRFQSALGTCVLAAAALVAETPGPVLVMPGLPEKTIAPESLLGTGRIDVRQEDPQGVTVYRGMPFLEVLEKNGLETSVMQNQRRIASAVVVAQGRDGYTVVFSLGELLLHSSDPRVFLVAETAQAPLPADRGPVGLIAAGQRARSAFGLARIELRYLGDNQPMPAPRP